MDNQIPYEANIAHQATFNLSLRHRHNVRNPLPKIFIPSMVHQDDKGFGMLILELSSFLQTFEKLALAHLSNGGLPR